MMNELRIQDIVHPPYIVNSKSINWKCIFNQWKELLPRLHLLLTKNNQGIALSKKENSLNTVILEKETKLIDYNLKLKKIIEIDISENSGMNIVKVIEIIKYWSNSLIILRMQSTNLGDYGLSLLIDSIINVPFANLNILNISRANLSSLSQTAISNLLLNKKNLLELDISYNNLGDTTMINILLLIKEPIFNLEKLNLEKLNLTERSIRAIIHSKEFLNPILEINIFKNIVNENMLEWFLYEWNLYKLEGNLKEQLKVTGQIEHKIREEEIISLDLEKDLDKYKHILHILKDNLTPPILDTSYKSLILNNTILQRFTMEADTFENLSTENVNYLHIYLEVNAQYMKDKPKYILTKSPNNSKTRKDLAISGEDSPTREKSGGNKRSPERLYIKERPEKRKSEDLIREKKYEEMNALVLSINNIVKAGDIRFIDISMSEITEIWLSKFVDLLYILGNELESLIMDKNPIGNEGLIVLSRGLLEQGVDSLTHLSMKSCKLLYNDIFLQGIHQTLIQLSELIILDLSGNAFEGYLNNLILVLMKSNSSAIIWGFESFREREIEEMINKCKDLERYKYISLVIFWELNEYLGIGVDADKHWSFPQPFSSLLPPVHLFPAHQRKQLLLLNSYYVIILPHKEKSSLQTSNQPHLTSMQLPAKNIQTLQNAIIYLYKTYEQLHFYYAKNEKLGDLLDRGIFYFSGRVFWCYVKNLY